MSRITAIAVRIMATIALAAAIGGVLVGCTPEPCAEAAVPGLAIAVGTRSNSPLPAMPDELTGELNKIITATENGDRKIGVTFVRVDGRPTIGCGIRFDPSAENDIAKDHNRTEFVNEVRATALAVRAVNPEADVLAALGLAAASAGPHGTVLLVDSGLQTKTPLSFVEPGLIDASADDVVTELMEVNAIPDLRDRKVILAGIGYTAAPQKSLDEGRQRHLVELWTKIVAKAGATEIVSVNTPNTTAAVAGLPPVTQVPVPELDPIRIGCNTTSIFTNESSVGFLPDSTVFRDPSRARAVLAEYAEWLRRNPRATALITGSIAHYGTDNGDSGLSRARAQKVREVLVDQLHVSSMQVTARGEGWGPVPSKDAPPGAAFDQLNRRVVIELKC